MNLFETNTALLATLCQHFQYPQTMAFGPLWNNPDFVLSCLGRYANDEGRDVKGKSVKCVAHWLMADHYGATGEEIQAVIRLLQLGKADSILG